MPRCQSTYSRTFFPFRCSKQPIIKLEHTSRRNSSAGISSRSFHAIISLTSYTVSQNTSDFRRSVPSQYTIPRSINDVMEKAPSMCG